MANTSKPLQIFKPGRHTAMSGAVLAFSESDLAASAAAYDPAVFEAPIVVGHPKLDAPAYGWVKSLAFSGGALEAGPHQVDPLFAENVAAGHYKKISAAFFSPSAPNNPVPGVYYLRHVGFLGAAAPAVKGLRTPEFAEAEEGIVEFSEWDDVTNASLWRSLRDWVIGKFGQDEADKVIPSYQVQSLEQSAQRELESDAAEPAQAIPSFSDPEPPTAKETSTVTPEQAAALEAENVQLKAQLRANHVAALHAGNVAFAEALVSGGKVLPAEQAGVVAVLDHFATQEAPVEFADGDQQKPLVEAFKGLLEALPSRIEFGEVASAARAAGAAAPLDDAEQISRAAIEFQEAESAAGRDVTYVLAVQHVVSQRKGACP